MTMATGDPDLVDQARRLVRFLREMATARRRAARDVAEHEHVLWLSEVPSQAPPDTAADQGDVLLCVEALAPNPPPPAPRELRRRLRHADVADAALDRPPLREIDAPVTETIAAHDAYERWLPEWRAWALRERPLSRQRRWHHSLRKIADRLSQQGDELELVLAAGLVTWAPDDETRIRAHLLTVRARLEVDRETERIDVLIDSVPPRLEDRDLLEGLPGFEPHRVAYVRDEIQERRTMPPAASALLRVWSERAFEDGARYADDWAPPSGSTGERGEPMGTVPEVRPAPALILRRRSRATLISYYDTILEALSADDAMVPLGLAQLVTTMEPEERLAVLEAQGAAPGSLLGADPLFPLPANREQAAIMERLEGDNGVVTQGPPGTGKTHTIANLTAALLARGQRVLVTSQKEQALRVLRDKLPDQIKPLCVSLTDQGRGHSAELEASVKSLAGRFTEFDPALHKEDQDSSGEWLHRARGRVAELTEKVRALRESETYDHGEIAPGYRGTLAQIAERLKRRQDDCAWMPVPMPGDAAPAPPITAAEAEELLSLLREETPERRARGAQELPDPADLPAPERINTLIAEEEAAESVAGESATELSGGLAACSDETVTELETAAGSVAAAVHELGLPADPAAWPDDDWAVRIIVDAMAGRSLDLWEQLAQHESQLEQAVAAQRYAGFRDIRPAAGTTIAQQLEAAQRLHDHLAGGGKIKRGPLRAAAQKQAETALSGALVDGVPPRTQERLAVLIAYLRALAICGDLHRGWQLAGVRLPGDRPMPAQVQGLSEAFARLRSARAAYRAITWTARRLAHDGVRVPLRSPADWEPYARALRAARLRLDADRATSALNEVRDSLALRARAPHAPPELDRAAAAIDRRDAAAYRTAIQDLARAHHERADQLRCDALRDSVRTAHAGLAALMAAERIPHTPTGGPASTGDSEVWPRRLATWEHAWAWGIAYTFFADQREPGLERRLDNELDEATKDLLRGTARHAADRAWGACLTRMTSHQAQALRTYADHMTKLGKGTGRYAGRYRRLARDAMAEAREAVPAWIMPIQQVLETIPADRDSFDVVIVDEASQASIESLFLLWLAPRVIVVGDDRQCAPSATSHGELEPIFAKLASYLPDMPAYLRDAFTPNSSLFDLLSTRFGSVIRLKEHFRCMPEIIEYSSRQFYQDGPLAPLRQYGTDRLPPLRVVRVADAVTEGIGPRLRNEEEARAIVERVVACIEDPAYDGKTFGVVVLQGSDQVKLIQGMLMERVEPKEWDKRELRVGTAPDFQGDERDVVFLSMVIAEARRPLTRREDQRRLNVAASRAKDQMWLFHSVSPDLLSAADLRRPLLSYMLAPPPAFGDGRPPEGVAADVPHADFDTLFEQRVYLRIRQHGYHVVPQFEVNGRRIDLVVSGAQGRHAVECDGAARHNGHHADLDRERELKRAGWRFWRVRESEFNFDPEASLSDLWDQLQRRGIHPL